MQSINQKKSKLEQLAHQFVEAANGYDLQAVLALFAEDAVIDDVSVGEKFEYKRGIRKYYETFFIGYHTVTELLTLEHTAPDQIIARVDFKGDFGHETGGLDILVNEVGLIKKIDAYLN